MKITKEKTVPAITPKSARYPVCIALARVTTENVAEVQDDVVAKLEAAGFGDAEVIVGEKRSQLVVEAEGNSPSHAARSAKHRLQKAGLSAG